MKRIAVVVSVLGLTACAAPLTKERVSAAPAERLERQLPWDYATVHRRILEGLTYCFMEQPIDRQLAVFDRRDKGARRGEVVFKDLYGKHGEEVHWVALSEAVAEGTRLQVLVSRRKWLAQAELVPVWAEGKLECGEFAPTLPPVEPGDGGEEEWLSLR